MFVKFSYFFEHTPTYEHLLAKRLVVDMGSPPGHIDPGPGAIRALWSVWQAALKSCFFFAGVYKDDFPGFSTRGVMLYVPVKCCQFFFFFFFFPFSRAHSPDIYRVDNKQQPESTALQRRRP